MEISNFDKLVDAVTKSILNKAGTNTISKHYSNSNLIIIPNPILGFNDYQNYLNKNYKGLGMVFSSNEEILKSLSIDKDNSIAYDLKSNDFINALDSYEKVIVIGPKIETLKALSLLNDSIDINHIIISRAMNNKPITILMNSNAGVLSKISQEILEIKNLGIELINIQQFESENYLENDLIMEKDIIKLKDTGIKSITISPKQIITPLAKDKLREYKISIEYKKEDLK